MLATCPVHPVFPLFDCPGYIWWNRDYDIFSSPGIASFFGQDILITFPNSIHVLKYASSLGTSVSFPGVKQLGHEADHSSPSSVKV
jgi:hypothetical protein